MEVIQIIGEIEYSHQNECFEVVYYHPITDVVETVEIGIKDFQNQIVSSMYPTDLVDIDKVLDKDFQTLRTLDKARVCVDFVTNTQDADYDLYFADKIREYILNQIN